MSRLPVTWRKHTIGQASAVVYRESWENAASASPGESLYDPSGEVKIEEQLRIAAISPANLCQMILHRYSKAGLLTVECGISL